MGVQDPFAERPVWLRPSQSPLASVVSMIRTVFTFSELVEFRDIAVFDILHVPCFYVYHHSGSWGNAPNGEDGSGKSNVLGGTSPPRTASAVLQALASDELMLSVATGYSHTAVLTSRGRILTFGWNNFGQCGQATSGTPLLQPGDFVLPSGVRATYMAASGHLTCAIGDDANVYCAGTNAYGSLGDNATLGVRSLNSSVPVRFLLPAGEIPTSVGISHGIIPTALTTCVVAQSGKVFCAGLNEQGQLGDGTLTHRSLPVEMQLPSGFKAKNVSIGYSFVW